MAGRWHHGGLGASTKPTGSQALWIPAIAAAAPEKAAPCAMHGRGHRLKQPVAH